MAEDIKGIKRRQDEKAKEIWASIDPPASQCKTCIFAADDTEYTIGAEKSSCDVYEYKPMDILWDKEECEYHLEGL